VWNSEKSIRLVASSQPTNLENSLAHKCVGTDDKSSGFHTADTANYSLPAKIRSLAAIPPVSSEHHSSKHANQSPNSFTNNSTIFQGSTPPSGSTLPRNAEALKEDDPTLIPDSSHTKYHPMDLDLTDTCYGVAKVLRITGTQAPRNKSITGLPEVAVWPQEVFSRNVFSHEKDQITS
jgi:hypothetical protein